jgi:2-dehydropantoate 2-reductase
MRFVIVGAGAIGSLVGGYLALSGRDAALVGRPQHVAEIKDKGLLVIDKDGERVLRVDAVSSVQDVRWRDDDVIFLCVKSQDTSSVLAELVGTASGGLPIFCFQNGVRNEEKVSGFFSHVYGVLVAIGGKYLAPGRVMRYASRAVAVGRYPEGLDARVQQIKLALEAARFEVTLSSNIMPIKWSKLIVNLCNPFHALTGLSIPEAYEEWESRTFLADIMQEGVNVLEAAQIPYAPLPGKMTPREEIERLRQPQPVRPWSAGPDRHHYPSTWQDLQLKRGQTEVESFNGEIVELGRQLRVPTPINELLLRVVKEMASRYEPPGKYSMSDLRAMVSYTPLGEKMG